MSDIAIKIQNLGKKYRIRHDTQEKYQTIREAMARKFTSLIHPSKTPHSSVEDFWALRDVAFEIKRGECVGIIGRNGAGKSTLLKILSRITEPTTGRIELHGSVASLLEVGTGFHQELTGRENVYLNSTILGMTRKEIDRKFDEIVAFAEIEKFLDTPVKRYSSGMYVRLAFAIAAHLETEILVVDEVLAVGDAQFQKKCLGKMGDVAQKEGKTVLFVSHNMGAVKKLCKRGVLLESGIKKIEGEITKVVDEYESRVLTEKTFTPFKIKEIDILVEKISLNEETGGLVVPFKPLRIDIELEAGRDIGKIGIEIMITHDDTSGLVFASNTKTRKNMDAIIKKGKNKISCLIHHLTLCSGQYWLGFGVDMPFVKFYYYELALLKLNISEAVIEPGSLPTLPAYGHVYLDHDWTIQN
jgi:lipopolysaccharide transport system ATP-binding protein